MFLKSQKAFLLALEPLRQISADLSKAKDGIGIGIIIIIIISVIVGDFLSQHPSPNHGLWEAKRVST